MQQSFWGALITAFLVCTASGPVVIPLLHRLKFGQSVRGCGPKTHISKTGTPTMGGVMILLAILVGVLFWQKLTPELCVAFLLTFGHAVIGFVDDYIKVVMHRNLGLTAKQKLFMQFVLAGAYVYYIEQLPEFLLSIKVPGTEWEFYLGWVYYALAFVLLVGTTNAVNLTDGLDGLAAGVTVPVALAYAYITAVSAQHELTVFALAMVGACLGFLVYNRHPAKIFMGDTGSLALGGGIAALALLTRTELLLVILGGIYVMEAASVIIQVTYFKISHGKRIFRMTPIHHHFELGGWPEAKVAEMFVFGSFVLCVLGVLLWCSGNGGAC